MFSDEVRDRFYFGTFELLMKTTLQLRFVFGRHCNIFFITSQLRFCLFDIVTFFMTLELRYIMVRSNYVRKLRYKMVIF